MRVIALLALAAALIAACGPEPTALVRDVDPRWSTVAPLPVAVFQPGATVYRDAIWVAGGEWEAPGASPRTYRYDADADAWERMPDLPTARSGTALVVAGDSLYAVGGWVVDANNLHTLDRRMWVFLPEGQRWEERARVPDRREGASIGTGDRIVIVGGGFGSVEHGGVFPGDSVAIYDPRFDAWTYGAPVATPRHLPAAVYLDGRIWTFGGRHVESTGIVQTWEVYDVGADAWSGGGEVGPDLRAVLSEAAAAHDGLFHFFGGVIPAPGSPVSRAHSGFDPSTGAWTELPEMPTARNGAMAVAHRGRLFLIGGLQGPRAIRGAFLRTVEVYTP